MIRTWLLFILILFFYADAQQRNRAVAKDFLGLRAGAAKKTPVD
jgi:hypothetical protein